MKNVERSIIIETEAAKDLISGILLDEDDKELVADTIEGETNLIEALEMALAEMDECEIMIFGLDAKIKEFGQRKARQKAKVDRIRSLIEQAIIRTESDKFVLSTGTISPRKIKPDVVIENEVEIPSKFFIEQPRPAPKLDKKALKAALEKNNIPGARLDNGGIGITIRRK